MSFLKKLLYSSALALSLSTPQSNSSPIQRLSSLEQKVEQSNEEAQGVSTEERLEDKTFNPDTRYNSSSFESVASKIRRYNESVYEAMKNLPSISLFDSDIKEDSDDSSRSREDSDGWSIPRTRLYPSWVVSPLEMIVETVLKDKRAKTLADHYVPGSFEDGTPFITFKRELDIDNLKVTFSYNSDLTQNRMILDINDKAKQIQTMTFITAYNPDSGKFEDRFPRVNLWVWNDLAMRIKTLTGNFSAHHPIYLDTPIYVSFLNGANRKGDFALKKEEEDSEKAWRNITRGFYDHVGLPSWVNNPPLIQSSTLMDEDSFYNHADQLLQKGQPLIFDNLCLKGMNMRKARFDELVQRNNFRPVIFQNSNLMFTKWRNLSYLGQIDFRSSTLKGAVSRNTKMDAIFDEGEGITSFDD